MGNDFGNNNETYFSASSGWRPTRFFDIAGTSRTILPGAEPEPFHSLDFELGVHGTPVKGLWYDVGLFWMDFDNRTESQNISPIDFIIVNTGSTRHRGFEGEVSYDLLAPFHHEITSQPDSKSSGKDMPAPVVPVSPPLQLIVFSNLQLLDAQFTNSMLPNQVGKTPAFAPTVLWKGGISLQKAKCFNLTLSGVYASDQFWSDANTPLVSQGAVVVPAIIPSYTVFNFSGEWYVTKNVRLFAGISNLANEKYYSRVFLTGTIEPAPTRAGYAGISVGF